jgi:uncharacterized protein (TIGR03083 family)
MTTDPLPADLDELAAHAVDALDADEAHAVEASLAGDARGDDRDAAMLEVLRLAGGEYAAAMAPSFEAAPPAGLRGTTIARAFGRRSAVGVRAADVRVVHLVETERVELLARSLSVDDWSRTVDPPEFVGWTVKDLFAHLASNEALLAQAVGAAIAVPEREESNEARTALVLERHRGLTPAEAIDEYRTARLAVDGEVVAYGADELVREISWWGSPMRLDDALVLRAFETWTHADDIRRATGAAGVSPSADVLARMSGTAVTWMPLSISATGRDYTGRSIVIDLTGPGGGTHHVYLGFDAHDLTGVEPDATIRLDVVAYCRALGDRGWLYEGGLSYESDGDEELVGDFVSTLDALAVL